MSINLPLISTQEPVVGNGYDLYYPDLEEYLTSRGWVRTQPCFYEHPNYPHNNAYSVGGELIYTYWGEDPRTINLVSEFGGMRIEEKALGTTISYLW